jgi:uncharacterized protein
VLEVRDKEGWTALMHAASGGRTAIVKLLLQHGADVNAANNHGATPLYAASLEQHMDTALCLLAAGADVNAATDKGCNALMAAATSNNTALVQLLLSHGADISVRDI